MAQPHRITPQTEPLSLFLRSNGCDPLSLNFIAGDASPRTYHRVQSTDGTKVLMLSQEEASKNKSFVVIARLLHDHGFHSPEVYAIDEANGYYLLKDLGDLTFNQALAQGANEKTLYHLGTLGLIEIGKKFQMNSASLPPYNFERAYEEAALLIDWYVPEMLGKPLDEETRAVYKAIWKSLYKSQPKVPQTLVLRDYMVDNLMWILEEIDIRKLGILDFQDALWGPMTYDIVSLLEDARRDVSPEVVEEMLKFYLDSYPAIDPDSFYHSYYFWGAQRAAKIIGIFTRLAKRDGKVRYLNFIPRVWRLLEQDVMHPALAPLKDWLDENIPHHLRVIPS